MRLAKFPCTAKPNDDRQPYDRDVRQHRCEAEQSARARRQQEDKGSDVVQAIADRQLVAEKAGGDPKETDQRTDRQHDPGLRRNSGLIGSTKREKDDDPLPQSRRTPDRRGIPNDQDERIAIAENRSDRGPGVAPWRSRDPSAAVQPTR